MAGRGAGVRIPASLASFLSCIPTNMGWVSIYGRCSFRQRSSPPGADSLGLIYILDLRWKVRALNPLLLTTYLQLYVCYTQDEGL